MLHPSIPPFIPPPSLHPSNHPSFRWLFCPSSICLSKCHPSKNKQLGFWSQFHSPDFHLCLLMSFSLFFMPLHSFTLSHSPKLCFTISFLLSFSHSFGKGRKCVQEGRAIDEANMVEKEVRIWWSFSTTTWGECIPKPLKANSTNTPTVRYVFFLLLFWNFRV